MMTRLWYLAVKRESTVATAVKPTKFLRFKDGDLKYTQEVIENNPIQNNRHNALNAVPWKITTDWTYNFDLDYTEWVHRIALALWWLATSDIWSTPSQVYRHTITAANTLPSLSVEQLKGDWTDTSWDRQKYEVTRWYGVLVDSFKLSASDSIVNLEVNLKAHGVFTSAFLINDVAAWSNKDLYLNTVEWLVATSDTVNIYDATPQSESDAIASISTTAKSIQIATLWNSYTVANKAKVELVPQTPSYWTAAQVATFTQAKFQFASILANCSAAAEVNVEDREFEYMNNLEERFWSLRSSPSVIAPKWSKATLKFTKYFETIADRDLFLQTTKTACLLTLTNDKKIGAADTNLFKYQMQIELNDLRFTAYDMPTWTDELYAVTVEASAFYDDSDAQAVRILFQNAKAWTEYTA